MRSGNDRAGAVLLGPSLRCGLLRLDRCPAADGASAKATTLWAHLLLYTEMHTTLALLLRCEGVDVNAKAIPSVLSSPCITFCL